MDNPHQRARLALLRLAGETAFLIVQLEDSLRLVRDALRRHDATGELTENEILAALDLLAGAGAPLDALKGDLQRLAGGEGHR